MKRGQLFTLDIFVALLFVSVLIGFVAFQLEDIYSRSASVEQQKIDSLAQDAAQVALKRTVISRAGNGPGAYILPNYVDITKWTALQTELNALIAPPYAYEVSFGGLNINAGACGAKQNVAVARRLAADPFLGVSEYFTVKVCA